MTAARRVVIASADYGGGHRRIAEALSGGLRAIRSPQTRTIVIDLLERCAPNAARLAGMAFRAGEPFFPNGTGDFANVTVGRSDDPVVRELAAGGLGAAEAALRALDPDLIVAVHPIAGSIAAEAAAAMGVGVATVIADPRVPGGWLHPGVRLHFVPCTEARDDLVLRGIPFSSVVVSGVPCEPVPDRDASRRRVAGVSGLEDRYTVFVDAGSETADVAGALAAQGLQVLVRARSSAPGSSAAPRVFASAEAPETLAAVADAVVCGPCGAWAWEAPAVGLPMIVLSPVGALERTAVDFLVWSGAALVARDAEHAADIASFLAHHPQRHAQVREQAVEAGRPQALRAVCERVAAELV